MRQIMPMSRNTATATFVPNCSATERKPRSTPGWLRSSDMWHVYCFDVSIRNSDTTQPPWMPSRPNSRRTGLLARPRFRTKAPKPRASIRCRWASKLLWRNSPSALAQRAASTEEHAIRLCRGVRSPSPAPTAAKPRTIRSPLPAIFLPAGFFLPAGLRAEGLDPFDGWSSASSGFVVQGCARMRPWSGAGDRTRRRD